MNEKSNPESENIYATLAADENLNSLDQKRLEIIRAATSWGNCDVYLYELDHGVKVLLKTIYGHPFLIKKFFWNGMLQRETMMMKAVQEKVPGHSAKCLAMPSSGIMVQEFLSGYKRLYSTKHYTAGTYPPVELFYQIKDYVDLLHENGIVHGDLRKANVMVDSHWHFRIVDWTTGMERPQKSFWYFFHAWVFHVLEAADDIAVQKMGLYYYPDKFPKLKKPAWYMRAGDWYRHYIYRRGIKRMRRWIGKQCEKLCKK
ncbi:MAG: RIO1 family regulatory kinase/ATPase [Lentisphaeria bacterium]